MVVTKIQTKQLPVVTTLGNPGVDTNIVSEKAVRDALGSPAVLGNGASQYQVPITGATPFVPVWSGFLLDGTTGGKTNLAITSGKTLTLIVTDNFGLTVPATGTAALLNQANSFTLINPLTTIAESWIGPSATAGIYFKGSNVGVGTTEPGAKLTVDNNGQDDVPTEYLRFQRQSQGSANYYNSIYSATGSGHNNLQFRLSNTSGTQDTVMTLRDGKVGCGTPNPGYSLDVHHVEEIASYGQKRIVEQLAFADPSSGLWGMGMGAGLGFRIQSTNANLDMATIYAVSDADPVSGAHLEFAVAAPTTNTLTEAMRIASTGNVGIGFTAPLSKLAINGGLHVGGESDAGDNNLLVDGTITSNGGLQTFGANDSAGAGYRTVRVPNA